MIDGKVIRCETGETGWIRTGSIRLGYLGSLVIIHLMSGTVDGVNLDKGIPMNVERKIPETVVIDFDIAVGFPSPGTLDINATSYMMKIVTLNSNVVAVVCYDGARPFRSVHTAVREGAVPDRDITGADDLETCARAIIERCTVDRDTVLAIDGVGGSIGGGRGDRGSGSEEEEGEEEVKKEKSFHEK